MAVANVSMSTLRIIVEKGKKTNGDPMLKARMYSFIRTDATPEQLHQVATALTSLQSNPVVAIERINTYTIMG